VLGYIVFLGCTWVGDLGVVVMLSNTISECRDSQVIPGSDDKCSQYLVNTPWYIFALVLLSMGLLLKLIALYIAIDAYKQWGTTEAFFERDATYGITPPLVSTAIAGQPPTLTSYQTFTSGSLYGPPPALGTPVADAAHAAPSKEV